MTAVPGQSHASRFFSQASRFFICSFALHEQGPEYPAMISAEVADKEVPRISVLCFCCSKLVTHLTSLSYYGIPLRSRAVRVTILHKTSKGGPNSVIIFSSPPLAQNAAHSPYVSVIHNTRCRLPYSDAGELLQTHTS